MKYSSVLIIFYLSNIHCLNPPTRICNNCIHYIANDKKCQLFSDTNIVTGEKTYDYASSVRNNETQCGYEAKTYSENHYKFITVPYYFLKDWYFLIIFCFSWTYIYFISINHI